MDIIVEKLSPETLNAGVEIWNEVVESGQAFPQLETLDAATGAAFFAAQTYTGVAKDGASNEVVGIYILHPNNVGRCGHICNASYAVKKTRRGCHIGEFLVRDCIEQAKHAQFRILQFNAVVKSNTAALNLYHRLGFVPLGTIPGGFKNIHGEYEDIIPHYLVLT